jgi:hypothetical protein
MSEIRKQKEGGSEGHLTDLAIYIVGEAQGRNLEEDPLDIGVRLSRHLRLRSTDAEDLMMGIWIAKKFGVEQDLIEQAKEAVLTMPKYEMIRNL